MEGAAVRELEEETGFRVDSIHEVSDLIVSDPGLCAGYYIFLNQGLFRCDLQA